MNDEEIKLQLDQLPGWAYTIKFLVKEFNFKTFVKAIAFVNKIALLAEVANHHPDIHIGYIKVTVTLTTHDKGEVTELDWGLAGKIEKLNIKKRNR